MSSPARAIGAANTGTFNLWRNPILAYEDEGAVKVAVTRSLGFSGSTSVTLVTQDGSATAPSDYAAQNVTLSFAPNEVVKVVTIPLVLDDVDEPNLEEFVVKLQNPTGGAALGVNATVTADLFDHDPQYPFINVGDVSLSEPVSGQVQATFHVTSSGSNHPVTLAYATQDGSAHAGIDYVAKTGTLTFAAGEVDKTVSVTVLADNVLEGDELFYLGVTGSGPEPWIADDTAGEALIHNTGGSDTIFANGFDP